MPRGGVGGGAGAAIANSREVFKYTQENSALKRNVSLEELGNTALYFVSDLSNAVTGENTGTLYSFGGDDDDSNNEWVGSDFEYANDLYQDARMGTGHIVTDLIASYDAYTERRKADSTFLSDTLLDVAAWFAADEAADAQELADSLSDNYARFDAMFNHLSDSISAILSK